MSIIQNINNIYGGSGLTQIRVKTASLQAIYDAFDAMREEIDFPGQDADFTEELNELLDGRPGHYGLTQVIDQFRDLVDQREELINSLENSQGARRESIIIVKRNQRELRRQLDQEIDNIEHIRQYINTYQPPVQHVIQGGQEEEEDIIPSQNPVPLINVQVIPGFTSVVSARDPGIIRDDAGHAICTCLLPFERDDELCRTDCNYGHIFHCGCISQWRNSLFLSVEGDPMGFNNYCPICRPPARDATETSWSYMTRLAAAPKLTQIASVSLAPDFPLNVSPSGPSFGKSKIKSLEKIIKYLLKL
jgi:hypothetical protein